MLAQDLRRLLRKQRIGNYGGMGEMWCGHCSSFQEHLQGLAARPARERTEKVYRSPRSDSEHDLPFRLRPRAFQHEMRLARIRERQDGPNPCFQLSTVEEASDLRQVPARDVDQKEAGFDAMVLRKSLIRIRHRRN